MTFCAAVSIKIRPGQLLFDALSGNFTLHQLPKGGVVGISADLAVFADDIRTLETHADDIDSGSVEELVHLLGSQNCFVLRERFVFAAQILIVKLRIVDDDGGIETGYRRGRF